MTDPSEYTCYCNGPPQALPIKHVTGMIPIACDVCHKLKFAGDPLVGIPKDIAQLYVNDFLRLCRGLKARAELAVKQNKEKDALMRKQLYDVAEAIVVPGMSAQQLADALHEYKDTLRRILCQ